MEYSIQNIKLLRNGNVADSLAAVKSAIEKYVEDNKAKLNFDGVAIVGRYNVTEGEGEAAKTVVKSVLGLVRQDSENAVTVTYVDATGIEADVEANRKAIELLNDESSVTGSVKNTVNSAIEALDVEDSITPGELVVSVSEEDGKISVSKAAIASADKTVNVTSVNQTGAIDLAVNIDGTTLVKDGESGKISVVSSALTQYVGASAVTISNADENNNKTISLKIDGKDNVLTQGVDGLLANVKLVYETSGDTKNEIKLVGKNGADLGTIDATNFIKDGMLAGTSVFMATGATQNVTIGEQTHEFSGLTNGNHYIVFLFKVDGKKASYEWQILDATSIVDVYTAGNGLTLSGHEFSVNKANDSEAFLVVDKNGVSISGVSDAIDTAKDEVLGDATAKTISGATVYDVKRLVEAVSGSAISVTAGNGIEITADATDNTKKTIAAQVKADEALVNSPDGLYLNFSGSTFDAGTF